MMLRITKLLCCTLALIMFIPGLPAQADSESIAPVRGYVSANTMKVYQYPHVLSRELGTMSYGEDVLVLAWQDGWMRVQNDKGQIGYCEYGGLSRTDTNNLAMYGYVKEAGAYVYAKPALGYGVIAAVQMGQRLNVIGMTKDKQWLRVQNGERFGYVQTSLMSKTPTWYEFAV